MYTQEDFFRDYPDSPDTYRFAFPWDEKYHEETVNSPCNETKHPCKNIDNLVDDDFIFEFMYQYPGSKPLANIYDSNTGSGDFEDVKALTYAYKDKNCTILSCDKNFLMLCQDLKIEHFCFKENYNEKPGSVIESKKTNSKILITN